MNLVLVGVRRGCQVPVTRVTGRCELPDLDGGCSEFHLFIRRQGSFYRVLAVLSVLELGLYKPGWPLRWGSPCCCTQPTVPFRLSPVCNP